MRAAGIPARIVTGYQGGLWQGGSNYLLVRQSDAHAWTEIWLEGQGWTRIDPTAAVSPARIERGARSVIDRPGTVFNLDWVERLRNRYDRIQHVWNRWVLGFDHERQRDLLERLGLPNLSPERIALLMLTALLLVSAPISYFLLRQSQPAPGTPVERAWRKTLKRLGRVDMTKRPAETPLEFADRVAYTLPHCGVLFRPLAEMYCQIHYGGRTDQGGRFVEQARRFLPSKP
jgi:hypothetical protein